MAARTVWAAIFWFEIRYHLRLPLFYLVTFFLSVLLFIAGTGHGPGAAVGRLHLNAPAVILELLVKGIFLVLFLMTAFVTSAAVRDFDRRTSELFFSKPISRFDYLTGRFAGTMVVCALAYLVGAVALAASTFMPWVDASRTGPFRLAPFAFGLGVLIIPTLLALGAAFYALASWTRSTLATYLGVVAFFAISATAGMAASHLGSEWVGQLLDPFGVVALSGALKYWTVAELNTATPAIGGTLLWNRILWLGLGFSALGLSVAAFDPSRPRKRRDRTQDATEAPSPVDATTRVRAPATRRVFPRHSVLVQFMRQVRCEATTVLWNLPFLGIVALGIFVLIQAASSAGNIFGMPVHPRTYLMLEAIQGGYSIVLLLVIVLYSGELIWKDRSLELDEILDSMPTPSGVYAGAKLTALLLVIAVFLLVGVLALVGFQISRGHNDIELGLYARGVALAAVYPILMMVLACFCHVVARSRLAGYGLVILFIISWDLLEELGFEHHLYRFASLPPTPWSDFNGYGPFLAPFAWYGVYWGFAGLVLVGLSVMLWRRGTGNAWRARWAEARARFVGPVRAAITVGAIGLVAAGSWIFYNTNVLNAYVPSPEAADRRASYERLYRQYENLDLPRITAVRADVDIIPDRRSVEIRGTFSLRNRSARPLRDLHVSIPERVQVNRLDLPAHDVILEEDERGYGIYRLRSPLEPGEAIEFGFDLTVVNQGFVNHGTDVTVIDNGTYFTKRDFFPVIGYDAQRQLADPDERRRRGLKPALRFAGIDDSSARRTTPRAPDADRVDFEATVSTSVDQIAVTSGELQREWVTDGRRYFHYKADAPITHHFAFASAKYDVTRGQWNGVAIEVYHHPGHGGNVGRMMDAARKSLVYFTANFGRYQHRSLRIVEFPRYVRDATSFPGMISFSEALGFNARLDGNEATDYLFYATAHEVAHQWWGQQVVGANVQGVGMLHETLAQYSALMVMEAEFGREKMRRVLQYELDWYLRGRGGERGVEEPLALVGGQDYVYYHKGALAMYALRDAVGEERLNQALSRYLASAGSKGPPYSTTTELLAEIRPAVPEGWEHLVEDLFEKITVFNVGVTAATFTERADGKFLVRVEVEAHKRRANGAGADTEIPIDDWMDIAVFGEREDSEGGGPVLFLERRRISASPVVFEIVVGQWPARVAIDPYYKLIDRDRGDNVRAVLSAGDAARHRPYGSGGFPQLPETRRSASAPLSPASREVDRQDGPPLALGRARLEGGEDDRPLGILHQDGINGPAAGALGALPAGEAVEAVAAVLDLEAVAGIARAGRQGDPQHVAARRQSRGYLAPLELSGDASAATGSAARRNHPFRGQGRLARRALEAGAVLGCPQAHRIGRRRGGSCRSRRRWRDRVRRRSGRWRQGGLGLGGWWGRRRLPRRLRLGRRGSGLGPDLGPGSRRRDGLRPRLRFYRRRRGPWSRSRRGRGRLRHAGRRLGSLRRRRSAGDRHVHGAHGSGDDELGGFDQAGTAPRTEDDLRVVGHEALAGNLQVPVALGQTGHHGAAAGVRNGGRPVPGIEGLVLEHELSAGQRQALVIFHPDLHARRAAPELRLGRGCGQQQEKRESACSKAHAGPPFGRARRLYPQAATVSVPPPAPPAKTIARSAGARPTPTLPGWPARRCRLGGRRRRRGWRSLRLPPRRSCNRQSRGGRPWDRGRGGRWLR